MKHNEMHIGQTVTNFGITATVKSFHPITGDPILEDRDGMKWVAAAEKCEPLKEAARHTNGFVVFA